MKKQSKFVMTVVLVISNILLLTVIANAATYTYDDLNRVTSVTYSSGQKVTYTYDAAGNMLTAKTQAASAMTVDPGTVAENQQFIQSFALTINEGSFNDGVSGDSITLSGDFAGLIVAAVNKTAANIITIQLSGVLQKNTGSGSITVLAGGTDGGINVTANVNVTTATTSSDTLIVTPAVVTEAESFNQTFTLKLGSGSFIDNITADHLSLGGDFTGLAIGEVNLLTSDTISVIINGNLQRNSGIGTISIAAAGTSAGNTASANVSVNAAQEYAAGLTGLSIKTGASGDGEELIQNFAPSNLNYSIQIAEDIEAVSVLVSADSLTTTQIYLGSVEKPDGIVNLAQGVNIIKVKASEPGKTDKIYNITITRGEIDECFIATAAFGSKFTWPVVMLRDFRDRYLLTNSWGMTFVEFYYRYSPPLASFIAGSEPLKALVKVLLVPVVAVVYIIYHPVLILVVICLLMIFFSCRKNLLRRFV